MSQESFVDSLESLKKALSVGYQAAPSQLTHGSALQVEDLEVTLKMVTFTCATFTDNKKLARLLRKLDQKHIPYKLTSRKLNRHQLITFSWNKKLKVGKRTFLYRTER